MLKLAMIFNSKMVFQQNKPIFIWGKASPLSVITVNLGERQAAVSADKDGNWLAELPQMQAETGLSLAVSDGIESLIYTDICVGEVWIAGGQSNMEFLLGFEEHFDTEISKNREHLQIRFFDYPEVAYEGELEDRSYVHEGFWRGCTKDDLGYYSAVGYYFAQKLQADLNVPIGIIGCNWGGTPACAWMDPKYLMNTEGEIWVTEYEQISESIDMDAFVEAYKKNPMNDRTGQLHNPIMEKILKKGLTKQEQQILTKELAKNMPELPFYYERRPGGLYGTMVKKIAPYSIRGVIWYQGETDGDSHPQEYATVFEKLIQNWRDLWKEELPFLFVQLAPFEQWMHVTGKNYGIVRACQERVSKSVSNTWMTTTGDVGMQWDIHPKNKKPVGERLALLAEGHIYGQEILCDPPELKYAEQTGDDIILTFTNAAGLYINGEDLKALRFIKAGSPVECEIQSEIRNNQLLLHHVPNAELLHLGQTNYYEINLYNEKRIPAKPFSWILQ